MNEVHKAEPSIDVFGFFRYIIKKITNIILMREFLLRGQVGNERFNKAKTGYFTRSTWSLFDEGSTRTIIYVGKAKVLKPCTFLFYGNT